MREKRRFSAAMMWSVEVGIQRRSEGHLDDFFVPVVVVVEVALISSAMDGADDKIELDDLN